MVSISLSPAAAAAHDYPNGEVQFSATGNYNQAPSTAPIQPAMWSVVTPQNSAPTISQSGLAQCGAAVGSFMVVAYAVTAPSIAQTNQNLIHANKVQLASQTLNCP
jgi:hypothetical protein